jgi:gingipain R
MKKAFSLFYILIFSSTLFAQTTSYKVVSNNQNQTTIDVQIGAIKQVPIASPQGNEVKISIEKGTPLLFKDCPDLPKLAFSIIIPNQKKSHISILESQFTEYTNIHIAPSKGSLPRNIDPNSIPFIYGPSYQKDEFFPSENAILNQPYILRDFRGQTVMINPVQYNPITKIMRVYSQMKVRIDYDGVSTTNIIESNTLPHIVAEEYDGIYKNHFINYKTTGTRYSPITEQGSLLVLCSTSYLNEILPFVKWKEMKGIKTYLVEADTIAGGLNETNIKNLVKWYYQNKQIAYLLIVGDNTNIPPYQNLTQVAGPSDNAYGYINNGDHYPELIVGRFSGETTDEIKTQVDRTLNYEKTPNSSGNWMRTQIGIASEHGTGDENQYDFEHIHEIVDSNKNHYNYLTNIEQYDDTSSSTASLLGTDLLGDPSANMLETAINEGASLINYAGHGWADGIVTTGFNSTNIPSLNNVNKLPFFMVVGCSPGEFVSYTCFAENLQRSKTSSNEPFGTISNFMSSILQNWDEPMEAQDEFNAIMRGARPSNLKSKLGAMCMDACMSMNDKYDVFSNPNGILGGSDMTDTWIFFGDPTVSLYTKNEGALTITHATHIPQNSTTYEVYCPINGATIGLYYQGKYLASSTVNSGIAYFSFPAIPNLDTVYITATKQNYSPAFGKAIVTNWATNVSDLNNEHAIEIYPNPTSDQVQINLNDHSSLRHINIMDAKGSLVMSLEADGQSKTISTKNLSNGLYILQANTTKGISTISFTKN